MKTGKWEYWKAGSPSGSGYWYFHLRAKNGKILLQSEGYITEKGCKNGIKSIQKHVNSPIVKIKE